MEQTEPMIQVGILSAKKIEFILNNSFSNASGKQFRGKQLATIENGKILFENELHTELYFEPNDRKGTFDLIDVVIGINFHWERKENQRFKGSLKFIVEQDVLTAINCVLVEDYLISVISSEMSASASNELLKAHAVISRSWLLCPLQKSRTKPTTIVATAQTDESNIERHIKWYERDAHAHFDVCADDHCQRYQGITRASTSAVEKAIEATRAEVLMYDNEICDARFSKSCGGITETFENCWAPEHYPYLTKLIDHDSKPEGFMLDLNIEKNADFWIRHSPKAFCNSNDKKVLAQVLNNYDQETTDFYRWKVEYTQTEIAHLIATRSNTDFGQIIDLVPIKRGESGRLIELKIIGTKKTMIIGKELEIRKWLSTSHLYSSAFVIDKMDIIEGIAQKFILTGAGWGHGVGLCQIGAAVMGEKGYNYNEILLHYFPGAELKKIY